LTELSASAVVAAAASVIAAAAACHTDDEYEDDYPPIAVCSEIHSIMLLCVYLRLCEPYGTYYASEEIWLLRSYFFLR
jgi:hypothetical protein